MQEIEYNEMFTSIKRYFNNNEPQILKKVSKRAAKLAKNLGKEKNKEEYPKFDSIEDSIKFKRDASKSLWKNYDPSLVEKDWDSWWVDQKFFNCDVKKALAEPEKGTFTICWPPSNVTGYLHAGHAITGAIEDCMTRWHRMQGKHTLFIPGVDHAGIATQTVVEKQLAKKGISRHDLGREKFVEEVYKWKDHSCDKICMQLRKMGMSMDWDRFVFTMDEDRCKAVTESFIKLKNDGIIYRANRLVNWSCALNSVISNIEVDKIELTKPTKIKVPGYNKMIEFGVLHEFGYKVKGTDQILIVATTRLETMLGDVAVAVHPDDERYQDLIGKELEHPFIPDRKMTVVADSELVDMEYGTGAVKVTPAHDENDFGCGQRKNLEFINIMNDDGTMNENAGAYQGMKRYDVRYKLVTDLEEKGLYYGKKPNPMALGICSRSKDVIEPIIKPQWYVKMTDELQQFMLESVEKDELHIVPEMFQKVWAGWVRKLQDWCISRQLWWGHRIPAYLVHIEGEEEPDSNNSDAWVCGRDLEEATVEAENKFGVSRDKLKLVQDDDVLDTWFSSALFPFSVTGWPDETEDFKAFFPNSILETGSDILFFWVAKMVIMSYYILDKQLPYKKVFLHSMVRDENGEKMSKSKGNVIDPLEVIDGCSLEDILKKINESNLSDKEKKKSTSYKKKKFSSGIPECGSDTLRFGLLNFVHHGKDINLDINVLIKIREFCNKIWNTIKFVMPKIEGDFTYNVENLKAENLQLADKWILTELNTTAKKINESMQGYHYHEATELFRDLWNDKFCSIYLEYSKTVLEQEDRALIVKTILFHIIESGLRILHPMMPFISEELYQKLPSWEGKSESICISQYPLGDDAFIFEGVEKFNDVLSILKELRSLLGKVTLPGRCRPEVYITVDDADEASQNIIKDFGAIISRLAKTAEPKLASGDDIPSGCFKTLASGIYTINCDLKKYIDFKKELKKVKKIINEKNKQLKMIDKKRSKPSYADKAPQHIKDEDNRKYDLLIEERKLAEETYAKFEALSKE